MTINHIFLIIAIVLFVLMTLDVALGSLNLLALGLAFFAAYFLPIPPPRRP